MLARLGFDVLSYPRMCGSTSTQPLAAIIACRYFQLDYEWVGREQSFPYWYPRSTRLENEFKLLEYKVQARARDAREERLALIIDGLLAANHSTHGAYVELIEGKKDIGLLARSPSPSELQLSLAKGVQLEVTPIARDAFVFLVNEDNPIQNLKSADVLGIYSGKITDWGSLGVRGGRITPYQRDEESGSQQLMRTLVMKDTPLLPLGDNDRAPQLVGQLMSGVYLELSTERTGIGYSVHYYEHFMTGKSKTKVIAIDGVQPDYQTIANRSYPYSCDVLAVTRKDLDANAPAKRLLQWLRSAEGKAVIQESGYVSYTAVER
jgi:phosphate transport system substrate-binding protein